ncbi:MAG: class I SAM-dependent methyltransferase [Candidatus Altiarchaeales archaeon]|nr:class I SAM-dependent methyltransferase [Candidatus Altiarchaeota archaeon]MCG2782079.1 class I SAM-dependent methyltransferase [Candidatus Altiarchaeales archaeon]MBU4266142.1 class I SAM-dependent methyltransferase [Candidatus Altiarchaeota archaeon]MBU4341035.1 class I SAM-dependent methyltransferase [Candidatus Altiarchaeota archaeon]MBU4406946.1 class I SAM-dependent methyltransferase [Candidatus Altiarchaeota archaeon]
MGDKLISASHIEFYSTEFGRKVMNEEVGYIRRELHSCNKILDVGCGVGVVEEQLPDFDIVGLDLSESMLKEARTRSKKEFIRADAQNLPFEDNSFDGVFYLTSFEFIPDYEKALEEASSVLKNKGKFLALIINPNSEYFKEHGRKNNSYFHRIINMDLKGIKKKAFEYFIVNDEYSLGIKGKDIFPTQDRRYASLYVIKGQKNG